MKRRILMLVLAAPAINAESYTFRSLRVPFVGATQTRASGINDLGTIVGSYFVGSGGAEHGFVFQNGAYINTGFNLATTQANGINVRGYIVGQYFSGVEHHGFIDQGSLFFPIFSNIDFPGASTSLLGFGTVPSGINSHDVIVGSYGDNDSRIHGFIRDTGGVFTTIDVPRAGVTQALGINNSGQIVGGFTDALNVTHGFLDTGGSFTTIDVPGATSTQALGINDSGQIVGLFVDAMGVTHGFLDTGGSFTTIDVPGATLTDARGINNSGQIVGGFLERLGPMAFSLHLCLKPHQS